MRCPSFVTSKFKPLYVYELTVIGSSTLNKSYLTRQYDQIDALNHVRHGHTYQIYMLPPFSLSDSQLLQFPSLKLLGTAGVTVKRTGLRYESSYTPEYLPSR